MDARLRNLFSRRKSQKHDQLKLRSHPYETTIKQLSPIRGTRPIAGNGPYRLENVGLQSQDLGAEPPDVPRSRRQSYINRPRTAPQSAPLESSGRIRSGVFTKDPLTSIPRPADQLPRTTRYEPQPAVHRVRSITAFSPEPLELQNSSPHVDLLEAVTQLNPSLQTLIQKRIASGKRDYGEDVADRNIAEFGGDEFPQHDAYSYYTDDAGQSQDGDGQEDEMEGRRNSRGTLDLRDELTWGPESRLRNDGAGDDITLTTRHTNNSATEIYSHASENPSNSSLPAAANSHAKRDSSFSDFGNAKGKWRPARSGRTSPASTGSRTSVIPASRANTITSTNLYYISGGSDHAVSTIKYLREVTNARQPVRSYSESRGTQTTPPPPEPIVTTQTIPVAISEPDQRDLDAYDPPPISRSRLSKHTILLTPPTSPTTERFPTAPMHRSSLDKELPPPPPGEQGTPMPNVHSRGGSSNYSMNSGGDPSGTPGSILSRRHFRDGSLSYSVVSTHDLPSAQGSPVSKGHSRGASSGASSFPQESARNANAYTPTPTGTLTPMNVDNSNANVRGNGRERKELLMEGSPEPPNLDGIVDLTNTTDTEVITTHLPAVVHERIIPKVHYIREERISREIHTHDVFHRIQPIIDVEVLPTKHYVATPDGKGLIEVPESQLPGRPNKWAIQATNTNVVPSSPDSSVGDIKTTTRHPKYFSGRDPIMQDTQKSVTEDGVAREETVWRHPAQLAKGGQTVPLTINHQNDEDAEEYDDAVSERYAPSDPYAGSVKTVSTNAEGEEELLYRDSDHAFDGALPGLEEANPVVDNRASIATRPSTAATARSADGAGRPSTTAAARNADSVGSQGQGGEATQALRRMREAELTRKMGQLSVSNNQK